MTRAAANLEKVLGGESAITASTVQMAIQMCLEVMGTTTHLIPCILSVTSPPDTLAAVMRAGGQPILLDIHGGTLQMDAELLKEALDELKAAVVILQRPGGLPIGPEILELVQDVPTIIDTRLPPSDYPHPDHDLCGTFNVFDLSSWVGSGAVIRHKYAAQQKLLRMVRSGVLGLGGSLPDVLAGEAIKRLIVDADCETAADDYYMGYKHAVEQLHTHLTPYASRGIIPWVASPTGPAPLMVFVPNNAARVVTQLRSDGIEASQILPLHLLDEVKNRWEKEPRYPVAEKIMKQVIAIPTEALRWHSMSWLAKAIGEVSS